MEEDIYQQLKELEEQHVRADPAGHRIAAELEALRRVATLVAGGPRPEEVFSAVAAEVGQLLMVDVAVLVRYDPPRAVTSPTNRNAARAICTVFWRSMM